MRAFDFSEFFGMIRGVARDRDICHSTAGIDDLQHCTDQTLYQEVKKCFTDKQIYDYPVGVLVIYQYTILT